MYTKSIVKFVRNASVVTIAGLTILSGTPALVQAAPMSLPDTRTVANVRLPAERLILEREYAREQKWLAGQQNALAACRRSH